MKSKSPLEELVGQEVQINFGGLPSEWPISGYPAWAIIEAVEPPLIKIRAKFGNGSAAWYNLNLIKTMRRV